MSDNPTTDSTTGSDASQTSGATPTQVPAAKSNAPQPGGSSANLDPITVEPQIIQEGAGKAYQSVAQSTAIAIQDATDNLRNLNTISTTTIGVAMAQFLATKDKDYLEAIKTAEDVAKNAAVRFQEIGTSAAQILQFYAQK